MVADIGDEQSLEESLSTFSAHMRRVSLLLDEAGSGSEERTLLTLATTYYADLEKLRVRKGLPCALLCLTSLLTPPYSLHPPVSVPSFRQAADSRFENASVAFDPVSLRPSFHILWGLPGTSHALSLAASRGLPPSLVARAARLARAATREEISRVVAAFQEASLAGVPERAATDQACADVAAVAALTGLSPEADSAAGSGGSAGGSAGDPGGADWVPALGEPVYVKRLGTSMRGTVMAVGGGPGEGWGEGSGSAAAARSVTVQLGNLRMHVQRADLLPAADGSGGGEAGRRGGTSGLFGSQWEEDDYSNSNTNSYKTRVSKRGGHHISIPACLIVFHVVSTCLVPRARPPAYAQQRTVGGWVQ
ncbi:unnamed protein product [Closterium sp. Naga37s-1]|nr:unnamed protein product [Closterium sp. Naga37s-1]